MDNNNPKRSGVFSDQNSSPNFLEGRKNPEAPLTNDRVTLLISSSAKSEAGKVYFITLLQGSGQVLASLCTSQMLDKLHQHH